MTVSASIKSLSVFTLLAVFLFGSAAALAANVTQGFTSDEALIVGQVVALKQDSSEEIELASLGNKERLLGVVTTVDEGLLTISPEGSETFVALSGASEAIVSDINGEIKAGDFLEVSPLKGTAMKADESSQFVLGVALTDFTEEQVSGTEEVVADNGEVSEVHIGTIEIDIQARGVNRGTGNLNVIESIGESIVGKPVSELQGIIALVIFFILLIVEGSILYGAIYSSIISLGRNPLSKRAIYSELLQIAGIAFVVLLIGLGAIYLVLIF